MKSKLHLVSALLIVLSFGLWASGGFHTGWTQTQIEVTVLDEITGIEGTRMEEGFIPGIELFIGGLVAAGVWSAAVVVFQKTRKSA